MKLLQPPQQNLLRLGRPIDRVGQIHYGALLDLGVPRSFFANLIVTSTEAEQILVQRYYTTYLHRPADPAQGHPVIRPTAGEPHDQRGAEPCQIMPHFRNPS